jgi:hypothetical protein
MVGVLRTSPVDGSMTVTLVWSAMARTPAVCVAGADAEVVHAAGASDAHFAVVVGSVVAQPVVAGVADGGRESRLRCGCVGHRRGESLQRPVGRRSL